MPSSTFTARRRPSSGASRMNCGGMSRSGRLTADTTTAVARRPRRRTTTYAVELAEAERAQLRTLIGAGIAPARMVTRARILLKADQGRAAPSGLMRQSPGLRDASHLGGPRALRVRGWRHGRRAGAQAPRSGVRARPRWRGGGAFGPPRLLSCARWPRAVDAAVSHETVRRSVEQTTSNRG